MKQWIRKVTAKAVAFAMLLTMCVVCVPTKIEGKAAATTSITYNSYVQSYGWTGWKSNGALSGKVGESKRLEGIQIKLKNKTTTGGIKYRTYVQSHGWMPWVTEGQYSGTKGEAKRIETVQIKLTGKLANEYDVYYRSYSQSYGWLGWTKNGATSGTQGLGRRLEGIQIKLVKKGGKAPGSTFKQYLTVKNLNEQLYEELLEEVRTHDSNALMKKYNYFFFGNELEYFYKDLDDNGVKELILMRTWTQDVSAGVRNHDVVGIFTLKGNKPFLLYYPSSFSLGYLLNNGELYVEHYFDSADVGSKIKLNTNTGIPDLVEGHRSKYGSNGETYYFTFNQWYQDKLYSDYSENGKKELEAYEVSHIISESDLYVWKTSLDYMTISDYKILTIDNSKLTGN